MTYKDDPKANARAVSQRRRDLKLRAADYKGGCCLICGYDRSIAALDFHHLDPDKKDFTVSRKGYTRSWEKTRIELDKCILLCCRCHRELHTNVISLPDKLEVQPTFGKWFQGEFRKHNDGNLLFVNNPVKPNKDERRRRYLNRKKLKNCKQCSIEFYTHQAKYCSLKCAKADTVKPVSLSKEQLQVELACRSFIEVAKSIGCGPTLVKKWARHYGLKSPKIKIQLPNV